MHARGVGRLHAPSTHAHTQHSELLELLLQHKASVRVRMRGSGHTPLMLTAMRGDRVRSLYPTTPFFFSPPHPDSWTHANQQR